MESKINRLRKISRNLPETNSSSSHSVVISNDSEQYFDSESLSSLMDENGIINIPEHSFGWEYEKYNDPLTKIQYVCGIYFGKGDTKKIKKLRDIIIKFTGAKDIVFEWAGNNDEGGIYIDHNSSDIFEEIIESPEVIKNFIFNKKSWLFLGNDNSDAPKGFYSDCFGLTEDFNTVKYIATIEFGYNIGNLEIEITKESLLEDSSFSLLNSILLDESILGLCFDKKIKEFKYANSINYNYSSYKNSSDVYTLYHYYINEKTIDSINKLDNVSLIFYRNDYYSELKNVIDNYYDKHNKIINDYLSEDKKDFFISFPIHINIPNIGNIC